MTSSSVSLALAGISFLVTVIWGGPLVRLLRRLEIRDSIRLEAPERHQTKIGTPTMGGVMFIIPVILITLLLNAGTLIGLTGIGSSILLPMGTMVVFALLGSFDDWQKLRHRERGEGMSGRVKLLIQ